MSEHQQQNIGIVSRGDVVRAIRQSIADSGIDLNTLIRESVEAAVTKRVNEFNVTAHVQEAAKVAVKASLWELKDAIGKEISRRIVLVDKLP